MKSSLDKLFMPASMALVGASNDATKGGGMFMKAMLSSGFKGKLYPVNRHEPEVMGLKAYPSVLDILDELDLVLLAIPAKAAVQAMQDCVQKKVKFVILHSAGFKEVGDGGDELDKQVMEIARNGGVRVVGPNCMGVYCPEGGINNVSLEQPLPRQAGGVGFISHSGTMAHAFALVGVERGLLYSKIVSGGNETDLNTIDYLEYLGQDAKTKLITFYLEGMGWGRRFLELSGEFARKKPIIVWKVGRTPAGARAALSHTASLAVNDQVCQAAFKQAGVIRAQDMEELCDFAVAFSTPYLPSGNRVAVICSSGGGAVSGGDACEALGLEVPVFPPAVQQQLKEFLTGLIPPFSGITNPVDVVWPPRQNYRRVVSGSLDILSQAADAFLVLSYYSLSSEHLLADIQQIRDKIKKPVFVVPALATEERKGMKQFTLRGIPCFPTIERAAKALSVVVGYAEHRRLWSGEA